MIEVGIRRENALRLSGELLDAGLNRSMLVEYAINNLPSQADIDRYRRNPGDRSIVRMKVELKDKAIAQLRASEARDIDTEIGIELMVAIILQSPTEELERLPIWMWSDHTPSRPSEDDTALGRIKRVEHAANSPDTAAAWETAMVVEGDRFVRVKAPPIPIRTPSLDWSEAEAGIESEVKPEPKRIETSAPSVSIPAQRKTAISPLDALKMRKR